jgi:hypothetical protein
MLQRALSEAEEAGDLKAALDITKTLLPIEQRIEEEARAAAAAASTTNPLAELSDEQLLTRAALIHQRMAELIEKKAAPPPVPSVFDSPVVIDPPAPALAAPPEAPEPPAPEPPPPDPDHIQTRTLEYGSREREERTAALWRQFRIEPPKY